MANVAIEQDPVFDFVSIFFVQSIANRRRLGRILEKDMHPVRTSNHGARLRPHRAGRRLLLDDRPGRGTSSGLDRLGVREFRYNHTRVDALGRFLPRAVATGQGRVCDGELD
jgi:hypothetical protein